MVQRALAMVIALAFLVACDDAPDERLSTCRLSPQMVAAVEKNIHAYGPDRGKPRYLSLTPDYVDRAATTEEDRNFARMVHLLWDAQAKYRVTTGHAYMTDKLKEQANSEEDRMSKIKWSISDSLQQSGVPCPGMGATTPAKCEGLLGFP